MSAMVTPVVNDLCSRASGSNMVCYERLIICLLLLQDPYANYVLQSALTVSNGQLHAQLVDAIRPYLPSLRGTPHGKRILSKINVKI